MTIREMQKEVHRLAREKGWHDYAEITSERIMAWLMLITTETAEAAECVRRGEMTTRHVPIAPPHPSKPVGLPSELADIAIRLMDTAEALGIDLQEEIEIKHEYNKTRTMRHGGKAI